MYECLCKLLSCSLRVKGLAKTDALSALPENAERLTRFAYNAFLRLLPPTMGRNSSGCWEVLLNFFSWGKQQCLSFFLRSQWQNKAWFCQNSLWRSNKSIALPHKHRQRVVCRSVGTLNPNKRPQLQSCLDGASPSLPWPHMVNVVSHSMW